MEILLNFHSLMGWHRLNLLAGLPHGSRRLADSLDLCSSHICGRTQSEALVKQPMRLRLCWPQSQMYKLAPYVTAPVTCGRQGVPTRDISVVP